jgi:hypothetical protein
MQQRLQTAAATSNSYKPQQLQAATGYKPQWLQTTAASKPATAA